MTSITNIFSNLNYLTKINEKENTQKNTYFSTTTPALNQGKKFKQFQKKIKNKLEDQATIVSGQEGFTGIDLQKLNLSSNGLTKQSNNIITQNNYSLEQDSINNLRQQYDASLKEYEDLISQINGSTSGYLDRTNSNNPYLNKTVRFTTGQNAYVTNQGVVKYIPNKQIWDSVNAPKQVIQLTIPWNDSWNNTPGISIPTTPPLITGTDMKLNQSLGNEGNNIFVNKLINNPKTTYKGCYADNQTSPLMTFIGGSPSTPSANIQNGNFEQPQIAPNSYQYISSNSSVPGWNFYAVLINNSTAWGYPMPYPNGDQAVCIQGSQILDQWIKLDVGNYVLTLSACGRPGYSANPINIYCGQSGPTKDMPVVYSFTPDRKSTPLKSSHT
jgi:hypothetical protein